MPRSVIAPAATASVDPQKDSAGWARHSMLVAGAEIGERLFDENGRLRREASLQRGHRHGWTLEFSPTGVLESAGTWTLGTECGTRYQFQENGVLLGTCRFRAGTGGDLWWESGLGGPAFLAEARRMRAGRRCGPEWWFSASGRLWWEQSLREDLRHGVEWQWGPQGGVARGFPAFWVNDARVSRADYFAASRQDRSLRLPRPEDRLPSRRFPAVVARALASRTLNA